MEGISAVDGDLAVDLPTLQFSFSDLYVRNRTSFSTDEYFFRITLLIRATIINQWLDHSDKDMFRCCGQAQI